ASCTWSRTRSTSTCGRPCASWASGPGRRSRTAWPAVPETVTPDGDGVSSFREWRLARRRVTMTAVYPRRTRTPSTLLAAVALGLALSAAPVAAQPAGDPVRPHLIDPQLRARLATAGADDRLDYLVVLAERADLAPIRFDRDAVVAELKRVAARSQRPVVAHL